MWRPAPSSPSGWAPRWRSLELARQQLTEDDVAWMRTRRPAARRHGVQCWHGGPRDPVWQFVGPRNAAECLAAQREPLGLVAHTHLAAAFQEGARRPHTIVPGEPLELTGKWLLNPGAGTEGCWLLLDLEARIATWNLAPFDPAPAHDRARALGLVD